MTSRTESPKGRDARWALVCGEAFQRVAARLIPKIPSLPEESSYGPITAEHGDLVACAANLGFALELYLKSLLVHLEVPFPERHDLHLLYQTLPQSVRLIVESVYDTAWHDRLAGGHPMRSVTLAKGPGDTPLWDSPGSPDLPEVLQRSKNLFLSWRYAFEFSRSPDSLYQFHQFEYDLLWCAAEALRAEVTVRLNATEEMGSMDGSP